MGVAGKARKLHGFNLLKTSRYIYSIFNIYMFMAFVPFGIFFAKFFSVIVSQADSNPPSSVIILLLS